MDQELKQAIKQCHTFQDLKPLLQSLDSEALKSRDVDVIYRVLQKKLAGDEFKIAYLGNYTLDPLPRYVSVVSAMQGALISDYVGEYNQYFQELLNPGSELIKQSPQAIFLALTLREIAPQIYSSYLSLTPEQRQQEQQRIISHIQEWVGVAKEQTKATLLIANFPRPVYPQAGIADSQLDFGEAEFYSTLNLALLKTFRSDPRVYVFDMDQAVARHGRNSAENPKMYYLAKMEWDEQLLPSMAGELHRTIRAIRGDAKKCLVLDLDNTLWGGIVGEDGVFGIKIGADDPEGAAYTIFQQAISTLKERGILLAICSKNNQEDVLEVFEKRKEMVLGSEDFAAMQINWQHKHQNIQAIAERLNIGTDSMVFIDDNPVECELIRQMLPEVKTVQLPDDPAQYAGLLNQLTDFEKLSLTDEDRHKNEQYQQNAKRQAQQQKTGDMAAFLASLGTVITIGQAKEQHVARVHQLFTKTNQFNLTTQRHSLVDIERFMTSHDWELIIIDVVDNFGALGLVGLILMKREQEKAVIDSFILSCRAMGRGIETAMINKLKQDYLINGSCASLQAKYIPTAKNKPVEIFYEQQGFNVSNQKEGGIKGYEINSDAAQLQDCPGIEVMENKNE